MGQGEWGGRAWRGEWGGVSGEGGRGVGESGAWGDY